MAGQPFGRALARPNGEDHGKPESNPWLVGLFRYRALLATTPVVLRGLAPARNNSLKPDSPLAAMQPCGLP